MANQVEIQITADPKNAEAGFKKTQSAFGRMSDSIKKHRKAIGVGLTAVGAGITALGASAVRSAQEEAIGITQLDQALKLVGTSYDAQAGAIERVIAAQQNKTNFGDEAQREALMGLISVSGDYESAMAALPAVLDLAAGKGMDLGAASTLVARAINGETSALKRYGIEVEKGADSTEVIAAIMGKFGGQAEAAADPMVQLKNRVGDLQQEFGKALLPALTILATLLERVTAKLIAFSTEHPLLTQVIFGVVAVLGGLALVLGPLLLLLPTITASIGIMSGAFAVLSVSMLPITAIVLGITAAIVAAIIVYKNWDKIILALKNTFTASFTKIKEVFNVVSNAIGSVYSSKWAWLMPGGSLVLAIRFLKNNWDNAITGTAGAFKDIFLGIWDGIASGVKSAVNNIINSINAFIRAVNRIKIRVPSVFIPPFGPTVGGFSVGMPQIPTIPSLAKGGIVTKPTLAMIGEKGPEAVVPLGRTGMTINLTINGDINGMDDFEAKVTSVIRDAVLGGGFSGVLARA